MSYEYDSPTTNALVKRIFDKYYAKEQFNSKRVLLSEITKKATFVGSQMEKAFLRSLGGGVSASGIPKAASRRYSRGSVTSKRSIATTEVDYESWLATSTNEGAFVSFQQEALESVSDNMKNNLERQLIRNGIDGRGTLAIGDAGNSNVTGAGTEADPYVVSLDAADVYFPATFECFEEGHTLNVNSETTDVEVTVVDVQVQTDGYAEGTIELVGTSARLAALSGTGPFDVADEFFMQKSFNRELTGALGILTATSGTVYGVEVSRRFKSSVTDAAGAPITADLLNQAIADVDLSSGDEPTHIIVHPRQYVNIMNFLEDRKRYPMKTSSAKNPDVGFSTLHYEGSSGLIPIVKSRFMDSDKIYLVNLEAKNACLHMRPEGIHLQQKDGNIWHRLESDDTLQARLAMYGEMFLNPNKQGIITNLAL